jgi:hypothetical protein
MLNPTVKKTARQKNSRIVPQDAPEFRNDRLQDLFNHKLKSKNVKARALFLRIGENLVSKIGVY